MGIITKIEDQKRNKNRVSIFVDGEYSFSVEKIAACEHGLKEGKELTADEIEKVLNESDGETAMKRSLKYVAIRQRTRAEIYGYLTEKGYSPFIVNKTIEKLEYYGYVNDAEFVKNYVEAFAKKRGVRRIREDLLRLGVNAGLADKYLENIPQDEACSKDAEKYLRTHPFDKNKLYKYLLSKGYDGETIYGVMSAGEDE